MCPGSAKRLSRNNFRVGDWMVHSSEGTVSRREETRHLEPKIMDLLVYLADHPTEVMSKDEILEAVWPGTYVSEVALTRSISELRTILGDDAKNPQFIETIPKRGYDWLEKSVAQGRLHYGWDLKEPAFENLREQPEFQRLIDLMRTRAEKQRLHVSAMAEAGELSLVPEGL